MGIAPESEASFQKALVDYATLCGWNCWHDVDSRRNVAGFPDLELLRRGVMYRIELKTDTGKLRPAQERYLALLREVEERSGGAVRVRVWRPRDWPTIQAELR